MHSQFDLLNPGCIGGKSSVRKCQLRQVQVQELVLVQELDLDRIRFRMHAFVAS